MRASSIPFLALGFALFLGLPALSQDVAMDQGTVTDGATEIVDPLEPRSAIGLELDDFLWVARPIVVFADTDADPRFREQMALLAARPDPLLERDVVIIFDTDPDAGSDIRRALRPRGFALVLMDKDGTVNLRRPSPRDVREITRAIDNMPIRIEETQ
ncbi:DUF4174 domain-containing protein [Rhodophyticola sp. CCM32]|uniref:DUF4174 domain-containing protein n=1 Tax=Rhodophyticola sp. CCM32 TaxID=2916397 RepID=UPI00107F3F26|nr:DUF4174 domain-containing protein [Rhodophyticola sp. CCM32]QBY01040.1 DUF4174 domain-containing protein [Rhodophyticola sp. CCM32]